MHGFLGHARRMGYISGAIEDRGRRMDTTELKSDLASPLARMGVKTAEQLVPDVSGIYAVFVDDARALPRFLSGRLLDGSQRPLYVGQAPVSLRLRLIEQDLRHRKPSTFFRGLGAVLGYRPPPGSLRGKKNQRNYKFSPGDTMRICGWCEDHLLVSWRTIPAQDLDKVEQALIAEWKPPLNTVHNPEPVAELAQLRKVCRIIAGGEG
jgi:hypothetical protein